MCDVTHNLLDIGKDVMRLLFTKDPMSLTSCLQWKKSDETGFHKIITHKLLDIREDVMRLPFTKWTMSLTCCWSYKKM